MRFSAPRQARHLFVAEAQRVVGPAQHFSMAAQVVADTKRPLPLGPPTVAAATIHKSASILTSRRLPTLMPQGQNWRPSAGHPCSATIPSSEHETAPVAEPSFQRRDRRQIAELRQAPASERAALCWPPHVRRGPTCAHTCPRSSSQKRRQAATRNSLLR